MFAGEDPLAASGVAQKAAQSSAPAEAAATLGVLEATPAWLGADASRWEQLFDICMRAAHAGVKEKWSARLPGSLK